MMSHMLLHVLPAAMEMVGRACAVFVEGGVVEGFNIEGLIFAEVQSYNLKPNDEMNSGF